jgi:hypothetical protein
LARTRWPRSGADHNLKPWKVDTFKVINDNRFEKKLADIVGLALSPTGACDAER